MIAGITAELDALARCFDDVMCAIRSRDTACDGWPVRLVVILQCQSSSSGAMAASDAFQVCPPSVDRRSWPSRETT